MHLNLGLFVHLFHHSSVIEHLWYAGPLLETTGGTVEEAIFPVGRQLSWPPFEGQAKLGVETTVMGHGQLRSHPSPWKGDRG